MKKLYITLAILVFSWVASAQISDYMLQYRQTGRDDFSKETQLLKSYGMQELIGSLSVFYSDSLLNIRHKAYYLTYKHGLNTNSEHQPMAVSQLLKGCGDGNGSVVGQCLMYLSGFPKHAFTDDARQQIVSLLQNKRQPHYKKLILLAGYAGAGQELFRQRMLLKDNETKENIWAMELALARMGHEQSIDACVAVAQKLPIGNELVLWLIPDLVYTRQKAAIDFCVTILGCDDRLCSSANPDYTEKILCGYRVMELLAPVVVGFPFPIDASGSLTTNDYQAALLATRKWFAEHPDYQILTQQY